MCGSMRGRAQTLYSPAGKIVTPPLGYTAKLRDFTLRPPRLPVPAGLVCPANTLVRYSPRVWHSRRAAESNSPYETTARHEAAREVGESKTVRLRAQEFSAQSVFRAEERTTHEE